MRKEELEQFIFKYGETLMKFCKITTNDDELARELYQDTMLRLVEHYKIEKKANAIPLALDGGLR